MSDPNPPISYEALAGAIEYALTRPDLTEEDIHKACESARQYQIGAVIARPSDVELVVRWLKGSTVRLIAAIAAPHGYTHTAAKLYEARDLLRRGAQGIDTTINTGKLLSRQFQYLEMELHQLGESCRESNATLTVNIESEYLSEEHKILACRLARRAEANTIGTNNDADLPILQTNSRDRLKIKIKTLSTELEILEQWIAAGVSRIELANPQQILEAKRAKLAADSQTAQHPQPTA